MHVFTNYTLYVCHYRRALLITIAYMVHYAYLQTDGICSIMKKYVVGADIDGFF